MIDRQVRLLSIRQPWAWAIVQGGKDVENRSYPTRYRGTVLIHASKGCTRAEYEEACESIAEIAHLTPPPLTGIERGGIIGKAVIGACVANHPSPWFFGPWGFVLTDVQPVLFKPFKGGLGLVKMQASVLRELDL